MLPESAIAAILPASEIPEAKWYCLRAQPKHEHIAAARLRQCAEIQVFCPRVRIQRSTRRGLVWFTEALFPNYLFARFAWMQSHALVRSCQGVSGIVRFGDHVPEVSAGTLEDLHAYMEDAELKTVAFRIDEGDDVEIVEGPFRGQNGVVKQLLPARERVKVLLEVLGGATEVDLSLTSVFKEAAVLVWDRTDGPGKQQHEKPVARKALGRSPWDKNPGERPRAAACLKLSLQSKTPITS